MGDTVVVESAGEVSIVTVGIQGPPGSSAGELIGGYNVALNNLVNSDLLSFDSGSASWVNKRAADITDGGNF